MLLVLDFTSVEKKAQKHRSVDANSSAMLRAAEVQANLPPHFPSFVKYMLPSHVSGGFWLVSQNLLGKITSFVCALV